MLRMIKSFLCTRHNYMNANRPLEPWMKIALYATAAMNIIGSFTFIPYFASLRAQFKLPDAHPLYLWILAAWILAFGFCYLWMAISSRRDRIFITIGAVGKLSFFAIIAAFVAAGDLPVLTLGAGSGDLLFGIIFLVWLARSRNE